MQSEKTMRLKIGSRAIVRISFLLALIMACISCGSNMIKGRPPFISISGMSLIDGRLSAEFDIRNQNGVPMTIDGIDITVTVNDVTLARENRDFDLLVGANSSEEVIVEELPDDFTQELLNSLGSGEVKSLPFDLEGKVHTLENGNLRFAHKGHLYPVPGKPGYFRSAVTRSKGLQREKPY